MSTKCIQFKTKQSNLPAAWLSTVLTADTLQTKRAALLRLHVLPVFICRQSVTHAVNFRYDCGWFERYKFICNHWCASVWSAFLCSQPISPWSERLGFCRDNALVKRRTDRSLAGAGRTCRGPPSENAENTQPRAKWTSQSKVDMLTDEHWEKQNNHGMIFCCCCHCFCWHG